MTLHLRHGRDFTGIVRSLDESHVFLEPVSADRVHIPFVEIQAVTDHGFGPDEPVETAPTQLQFRRNLADWEAELRAGFHVSVAVESDKEPAHLAALDSLRAHCVEVTTGVARDREAYKAFARAVQSIRLSVADVPSVNLSGGTLNVATCLAIVNRMRTQQIRAALELLL